MQNEARMTLEEAMRILDNPREREDAYVLYYETMSGSRPVARNQLAFRTFDEAIQAYNVVKYKCVDGLGNPKPLSVELERTDYNTKVSRPCYVLCKEKDYIDDYVVSISCNDGKLSLNMLDTRLLEEVSGDFCFRRRSDTSFSLYTRMKVDSVLFLKNVSGVDLHSVSGEEIGRLLYDSMGYPSVMYDDTDLETYYITFTTRSFLYDSIGECSEVLAKTKIFVEVMDDLVDTQLSCWDRKKKKDTGIATRNQMVYDRRSSVKEDRTEVAAEFAWDHQINCRSLYVGKLENRIQEFYEKYIEGKDWRTL